MKEEIIHLGTHSEEALTLDFADQFRKDARIRVVGVGGAGGNAVNRMIEDDLTGVNFIAMNTDLQALDNNRAPCRIQIGKNLTRGLGAGGVPEIGRKAIEENKDAVIEALAETDMVFITAGMGGGTGTGAAPIVAEIARDLGALTVGIVTKPFQFEGLKRMDRAEMGIKELKEHVDTLIIVPNQKLLSMVPKEMPVEDAFRVADEILLHATKGISDLINIPGLINLDFADVKTVMNQMGDALMGSGTASGENRAKEAAIKALSNSLIDDVSIMGALGVLVNITGGRNMNLNDINEANTIIFEAAGNEANIIFGAVIDPTMNEEIRVTVIATGFNRDGHRSGYYDTKSMRIAPPIHETVERSENAPLFQKLETDPLEQLFGHDGSISFISKEDVNIPAFIRKRMD
jgi:cell division protein FtsZ